MLAFYRLSIGRVATALTVLVAVVAVALAAATPASAQSPEKWPTRPVRFILSIGPGSASDITARMLAERLTARWGQTVIVENRPGGDAILAINSVLNAHDDHVLLYIATSAFTAHPLTHATVPYNVDDLEPIARVTNTVIGVGVPTSLGVSSLKELFAKVRAEPGKLNYVSSTGANDLLFASYLKTENLDMSKVPYRDPVAPATDLAEGRVHTYVTAYAILRPHIISGKVKIIALTNPTRAAAVPDTPTAAEAGYPALTIDGLAGLFGPRGMSLPLRERVAADVREVLKDKAIADRLLSLGLVVNYGGPAEFSAAIGEQRKVVQHIADTLQLKPE